MFKLMFFQLFTHLTWAQHKSKMNNDIYVICDYNVICFLYDSSNTRFVCYVICWQYDTSIMRFVCHMICLLCNSLIMFDRYVTRLSYKTFIILSAAIQLWFYVKIKLWFWSKNWIETNEINRRRNEIKC